jgi:ABC-2 type transport system permease protein
MTELPVDSQAIAPAAGSETRPMYWSVRRELWENRSIYIAPLVVTVVVMFGFVISLIGLPHRRRATLLLDPAHQRAVMDKPWDVVTGMLLLTAFIVGVFYCLDALHGERRDRSILFWKSLPVSDLATVLSKASIPLVVLPLLSFAIIVIAHIAMLLLMTAALLATAPDLAFSTHVPLLQFWVAILYALIAIALWHAPIYAWLLLISAWARRATFLWAVLPLVVMVMFERIAFGTSHIASLIAYRLIGWFTQAFIPFVPGSAPVEPLDALTPGKFLSTPGLWIGLALAAAFLAATVRLRRYREPI